MNLFQQYLAEEFAEEYEEGRLTRREALKLIASVTGSVILANSILAACVPPDPAAISPLSTTAGETVSTEDPSATSRVTIVEESTPENTAADAPTPTNLSETESLARSEVQAGPIEFPSDGDTLRAYLARPGREGSFPVVLVCHENRGLTPHIQDVARRLAEAGYVALAVDLLSRQGGSEALGSGNVPGALGSIPPDQFVLDFLSGWRYLQEQPYAKAERVGMVGFCFGGGVTWLVATKFAKLKAAVPFYGPHPPVEDVPGINAPVLAIYAGRDQRINQGIPAIEEAMAQSDKIYENVIYPGTDHAFNNDTGSRYAPEAAMDAWKRTLQWFEKYL